MDFSWEIAVSFGLNELDAFARPTRIRHSSTLGFTRNETLSYADYSGPWVLGRRTSTLIDGYEAEAIQYYPTSVQPEEIKAFGVRKQTRTYRADGTLEHIIDGRNKQTSYLAWHRGIPGTVQFADESTHHVTVDTNGWVTGTTNERGWITGYPDHDPMGRIQTITPPFNPQGQPWASTSMAFTKNSTAAYGLPADGHWRHRETRGSLTVDTYYDGLWRPVVVHRYGPGGTQPRFQVTRYDGLDRVVFRSYPIAALSDYQSPSLPGVHTSFDAIGRVYNEIATSELGPLTTQHRWQPGFRLQTTNPRGHATTTDFQAWSDPDVRQPVRIESPEGRTTEIRRDVFGKPLRIARSTTINGAPAIRERWYGYDQQQRLCQRLEPETGLTVLAYDAADNLEWSAHGLSAAQATFGILFAHGFEEPSLPGPGVSDCGRSSVPASERITRSYDDRNRLESIDYPDATADIGYTWHPDGTLHTASRAGSEWTYEYTTLGARWREELELDSQIRVFEWGHNPQGDVTWLSYPDGTQLAYLPNVHGEPTQVGSFASAITRHPDGSLDSLTLGNGITLTRTRNARGLTGRIDYGNSRLDLGFAYDANGNLTTLTDHRPGGSNGQSFPHYDGADRLRQASGAYGTALYDYDAFDDLRRAAVGGVDWRYDYALDTGLLGAIRTPAGTLIQTFPNYLRGHMTQSRGLTGPVSLEYDRADTVTRIVGGETYRYDALGRRTEVQNGAEIHQPIYTHDGVLRVEYGPTGIQRYVHLDGQLLARVSPTGTQYALSDHQGTPLAWADAAGQVVERASYTPFGARTQGPPVRGPGYTGHAEDPSGLTYMQARYQSPVLGRMLSPDPVGAEEDPERHFNRYAYANNNPVKYVDPDGQYACEPSICGAIKTYVAKLQESRQNLRDFRDQRKVDQVLRYIGKEGTPGPNYKSGELKGDTVANTDQKGNTTIDTSKVDNPTFGAMAIGHEARHDIDAQVRGRDANTSEEVRAAEKKAYGTEGIIGKGLGVKISPEEQVRAVDVSVKNWESRQKPEAQ